MQRNNVKHRAYYFSLEVIDFLIVLPNSYIFQTLGKQFLRAATSIGANIIEAQAGRTKRDFTNFYHIALKSSNEAKYWLMILRDKLTGKSKERAEILLREAIEISNMLGASLITLKGKTKI